jgi:hypothetical protein
MQPTGNPQQAEAACQRTGSPDNEVDALLRELSLQLQAPGVVPSAKPEQEPSTAAAAVDQNALASAQQQPGSPEEARSSLPAEEQRALRCLVEIFCEAGIGSQGWDGTVPAEYTAGSPSPFPQGSMAQWLYARMGSNPTVATLLTGLLCPLIKVSSMLCG